VNDYEIYFDEDAISDSLLTHLVLLNRCRFEPNRRILDVNRDVKDLVLMGSTAFRAYELRTTTQIIRNAGEMGVVTPQTIFTGYYGSFNNVGVNMVNSQAKTNQQYVRSVSDYTTSNHQTFTDYFGFEPRSTTIAGLKNVSLNQIGKVVSDIEEAMGERYSKIKEMDTTYTDFDGDGQSYIQSIIVFATADKEQNHGFVIEFVASTRVMNIIVSCTSHEIKLTLEDVLKNKRNTYVDCEENRKERTFYTISRSSSGFELETMEIDIKHSTADIAMNYNDDFVRTDEIIKEAISQNKKGLILLHGIPGSGKTSYIKHLITSSEKRKIVYVPSHLAPALASPDFIGFVKHELKNSVLVIEDAEQVLITRESLESQKEAVSNILNLTDGILADAINVLIVCTFNTDVNNLDKALLRKGRLLLQYEFKALATEKANALTQKLYGREVNQAMALCDIFNLEYELIRPEEPTKVTMGFR